MSDLAPTPDALTAPPISRKPGRNAAIAFAVLVVAACVPFVVTSPSRLNLAVLILMAAQLGVAWNILGGYAGQISLGHAAFFGVGAYVATILFMNFDISPWIGIPAGGLVAALIGILIGWSCFRLKGHYFAMATIAVAEIVQIAFNNWDYAGAAVGLTLPMTKRGWSVMIFNDKASYYYLALGLLVISLLVNFAIERSFLGYYFRAIKDEPDAARSLGVGLTIFKQIALFASSFLTAMGGGLYAFKELYIDPPSVLSTGLSIKMALAAILGGVGTLFGPVVGAVILTAIEEGSRAMLGGSGRGTDLILYALIIIGIAIYYPRGVIGWLLDRRERRRTRARAADATLRTGETDAAR
jgi:branched-chain amino acid transport system permease protein